VAFANAGNDFITATKQAAEFGVTDRQQRLVVMVVYITDIHSLGLKTAQGLIFSNAFGIGRQAERGPSDFRAVQTNANSGAGRRIFCGSALPESNRCRANG
jgi:hypothetical protein